MIIVRHLAGADEANGNSFARRCAAFRAEHGPGDYDRHGDGRGGGAFEKLAAGYCAFGFHNWLNFWVEEKLTGGR